jgi:hypothetical protein
MPDLPLAENGNPKNRRRETSAAGRLLNLFDNLFIGMTGV